MAEVLNNYFASVFIRDDASDNIEYEQKEVDENLDNFDITIQDVKDAIDQLKLGKAPGPDGFSSTFFKKLRNVLALPLLLLFQSSLSTGEVPSLWKLAKVIPIFKKGARGNPANYRPVSLTCIICKLLERIIRNRLYNHLIRNNLINNSQHGFMSDRSTQTNLIEFLDWITNEIDKGEAVDIVYLDFSKAFDKISHIKLIKKLHAKGVRGKTLQWIKSWLSNRKQKVFVNGKCSGLKNVDSSVPQGSVLGPILFIAFIDDIDDYAELIDILKKFADDTKGAKKIGNQSDIDAFQTSLNNLIEWGRRNSMTFNAKKCKIMHCGRNNPKAKYNMNGVELAEVDNEKDIGITVSSNLKPSKHCEEAANRARAVLGQISRCFHYRDRKVFLRLYIQYVRPHLKFSCSVCHRGWLEISQK